MKNLLQTILAMVAIATVVGCNKASDGGTGLPTLAVSIEPQRKILEELAGDHFKVISVLSTGGSPESFEPSMSQRKDVSDALAYFTIGNLPFEQKLAQSVSKETKVYDASQGIELVYGTHSHGHGTDDDHDSDPHVWTSFRNGKIIAANFLNALTELDPDNSAEYQQRYAALTARLDSLDAVADSIISNSHAHAFAIWHPSLSYLARDYNLHQIAVGQESKESSIKNLSAIIEEAKEDSVRVFFFQREYDTRQAETINKEIGSRLVTTSPLDYDWEQSIIDIAHELAR